MLSRNFRLQNVGDFTWLSTNYNFSKIAFYIDELIILNVTRNKSDFNNFCHTVNKLTAKCFVPIAAGGWIRSLDDAKKLLRNGADKVILNQSLFNDKELIKKIAINFGQQCVVGSVDLKRNDDNKFVFVINQTTESAEIEFSKGLNIFTNKHIGELYLNSIDQDGTGNGYDMSTLELVPNDCNIPIIMAGGVGNAQHFKSGLCDPRVNAVATAHLFNFIGDGLMKARKHLLDDNQRLAEWIEPSEI